MLINFFPSLNEKENLFLALLFFVLKGSIKNNCKLINKNYYKVCERTLWNRLKSLKNKGFIKTSRTKNLFGLNKYEFSAEVENVYKNKKINQSEFLEIKNKLKKLGLIINDVEIVDEFNKAKDNPKVMNKIAYTIAVFKKKYANYLVEQAQAGEIDGFKSISRFIPKFHRNT